MCHRIARAAAMLASWLIAGLSWAHVPYLERLDHREGRPFVVPKSIEQSIAVYAWLRSPRDADVYAFELGPGSARVFVEALVPVCPGYENLLPWFAIVGPGLPPPPPGVPLPIEPAPGEGAVVMPNLAPGEPRDTFYEPFGANRYYQGPRHDAFFDGPGAFRIVFWDPFGVPGDYVAVIGAEEIWEPDDIVRALRLTPVIRRGGELHVPCP